MKAVKKIHLIGSILKTVCGKELEEVQHVLNKKAATCKSCLSQAHAKYPQKVRANIN